MDHAHDFPDEIFPMPYFGGKPLLNVVNILQ